MTAPQTLSRVDAWWAGYFGCRPEDLRQDRTLVVPHAALTGYIGAVAFRRGPACVVSIPEMLPRAIGEALSRRPPGEAFDAGFLQQVFGDDIDALTGPAWLGVADRGDFRPAPSPAVRLLGPADTPSLRRLAEGCGELAWGQSKVALDRAPLFGYVQRGEIVAASSYEVLGSAVAYVGVVTHPANRGRGCGRAAASASVEHALGRDLVALWRTLQSNERALAVGRSLGFREYAHTLDVRLAEPHFS